MPLIVSPERTVTLTPLPVFGRDGCGAGLFGFGVGVGVGAVVWPLGLAYLFYCAAVPRK